MINSKGLHHLHKRVREKEDSSLKRVMDSIIYVIAIVGPLFALPQVWKIWMYQNAVGVSLLSWSGFLVVALFWLFYGILHKELPLIISNSIWVCLEVFIVVGILLYG